MRLLTRTEEMILLTVFQLGEEASGSAIRTHIEAVTNKRFSIGGLYVPLERLTERGLLATRMADPRPERGGRRKRFYRLTPAGRDALATIKQIQDTLWAGWPV